MVCDLFKLHTSLLGMVGNKEAMATLKKCWNCQNAYILEKDKKWCGIKSVKVINEQ